MFVDDFACCMWLHAKSVELILSSTRDCDGWGRVRLGLSHPHLFGSRVHDQHGPVETVSPATSNGGSATCCTGLPVVVPCVCHSRMSVHHLVATAAAGVCMAVCAACAHTIFDSRLRLQESGRSVGNKALHSACAELEGMDTRIAVQVVPVCVEWH